MERKSNSANMKTLIDKLIRSYGLESKMQELDVMSEWENIVGKMIARHTKDIQIRNKILYITLDSAPLKQELLMNRTRIIELVNEKSGKMLVQDVFIK
jgi:predicted nucleic acid-binding Zn ribbon protein